MAESRALGSGGIAGREFRVVTSGFRGSFWPMGASRIESSGIESSGFREASGRQEVCRSGGVAAREFRVPGFPLIMDRAHSAPPSCAPFADGLRAVEWPQSAEHRDAQRYMSEVA